MCDPKDDADNHANQLNPNNDAYWESRSGSSPDDDEVENEKLSDSDD
jgi:hypothetical protein